MKRIIITALVATAGFVGIGGTASAAPHAPTCTDILDIAVHGHHVVGDYVTGLGHDTLEWSPSGGVVGKAVSDAGGAVLPGGPGPRYHFANNIPPGASFCTGAHK